MKYDPDIHHRRSIRLKDNDYSLEGAYFITICTRKRELYFDRYPLLKEIVFLQWQKIPERYTDLELDEFVVMPNHIHGIIIVGATLAVAPNAVAPNDRAGARPAPTVGEIVGAFKSLCVNDWLKHIKENGLNAVGKFWQRNYYEHIIRNEDELNRIREYIWNNQLTWQLDGENPQETGCDGLENEIFRCVALKN